MLFSAPRPDLLLSRPASTTLPPRRQRLSAGPPRAARRSTRLLRSPADRLLTRAGSCASSRRAGWEGGRSEAWWHHHRVLRQHPGAMPADHSPPPPRAAGRSIRPLRGEIACSLIFITCRVVAAVRRVLGRRRRERAGPSCTRRQGDKKKSRDGAYQHHLKFSLGSERWRRLICSC